MEIQALEEWNDILDSVAEEKGIVLFLGATDTGKSTLAKYLISQLCQQGVKTALVDVDIGQSFLGPPTAIGLSVFDGPPDWDSVSPREIFFVGSTSPQGLFSLHVRGTRKMVDRALACGAKTILVDTTGFVHGEFGRELKQRKIDLLLPQFIVALASSEELEPILTPYRDRSSPKIFRLKPSAYARPRTWEERELYRAKKFREYFEGAETRSFMINGIRIEGKNEDLAIAGLLLGLKDENNSTLALGLLIDYKEGEGSMKVLTPLEESVRISALQIGAVRLTPSFEDERF